jgi:hypothetical protein
METPRFSSALSTKADSDAAIEEVSAKLVEGLAGGKPDLAALFVSHHHGTAIENLGPRVAQATGARVLIGCTGEGIVGTTKEIERGAAISIFGGIPGRSAPVRRRARREPRRSVQKREEVLDRRGESCSSPIRSRSRPRSTSDAVQVPGVPWSAMASGGNGPGQNPSVTAGASRAARSASSSKATSRCDPSPRLPAGRQGL